MSYGPPKGTLLILGTLIGALMGLIYSEWIPPLTSTIEDTILNAKAYGIVLLVFVTGQYLLGLMLKRPYKSRSIYLGLLVIPVTWLHSMLYPLSVDNLTNYFVGVFVFEIPMLTIFIATAIIGQFLPLLVGYNRYLLDTDRIPLEATLGFTLKLSEDEENKEEIIKLIDRLVKATGFESFRRSVENGDSGWIMCAKENLDQGIVYELKEQDLNMAFLFFEITNDTVRAPNDFEEIHDFRAQLSGLFDNWSKRKIISEFSEVEPNLHKALEQISKGLGPLRIPRQRIWKTIKRFPGAHPYQFTLIVAFLQILVTVLLFYLSR